MPLVAISDENFTRLQKHAVPLVDSLDTVLAKALDALDGAPGSSANSDGPKLHYSAASAPDLSFTTVKHALIDGTALPPVQTYWNNILLAVVQSASKHGATTVQIGSKLLVNHLIGKKEDGGYRYVPEAGLSVQGQDANGAWKATYFLAREFGIKVEVMFAWQNNPKAANPGLTGNLSVGGVFE